MRRSGGLCGDPARVQPVSSLCCRGTGCVSALTLRLGFLLGSCTTGSGSLVGPPVVQGSRCEKEMKEGFWRRGFKGEDGGTCLLTRLSARGV